MAQPAACRDEPLSTALVPRRLARQLRPNRLCSSLALEPHWRRLRDEFGGALDCRYRLAGMIADWDRYNDPLNAVSGRYKWAGLAAGAAPLRGARGRPDLVEDPPASSYPACIAIKAPEPAIR